MATLTDSLRRVKAHLHDVLPDRLVRHACRAVGHRWRERTLTPTVTTYLLLEQVLHGNPAVGELRHHSGLAFTASPIFRTPTHDGRAAGACYASPIIRDDRTGRIFFSSRRWLTVTL